MDIRPAAHPKRFLDLLLIGDEEEAMIDRYLGRAETFVLYEGGVAESLCVVTREGPELVEIKNLATRPDSRGRGYACALIAFIERRYAGEAAFLLVGTGETPTTLGFYERRGFVYSHRVPHFFRDSYARPIVDDGVLLDDMIYLKKAIGPKRAAR